MLKFTLKLTLKVLLHFSVKFVLSVKHTFIILFNVLFGRHVSTFDFIGHLKRILIYQSNRIVTEINVIYTNTKLVSVWDPMAHLM